MDALKDNAPAIIDESIFADLMANTYPSTFKLIEKIFYLELQELKDQKVLGYVREITESRNAVAHGRESALTVGGRYTSAELSDRATTINKLIAELLSTFDGVVLDPRFIKKAERRRYIPTT